MVNVLPAKKKDMRHKAKHSISKNIILDFKLLQCSECCV